LEVGVGVQGVEEHPGTEAAELGDWLGDGAEVEVLRQFVVVDSDHGDVVRDTQAGLAYGVRGADRHLVGAGEDRSGPGAGGEQATAGGQATERGEVAGDLPPGLDPQARHLHCHPVAEQPFSGGREVQASVLGVGDAAEVGDAGVPQPDEMANGGLGCLDVVDAHA